ncbi:hypothetical protein [Pseudophaeobacter sp.]|uniref:hypothetical protein n=1 Tax=Pseudophaeobacter sp. TaxID=1971739 RepID=UPI003297136A
MTHSLPPALCPALTQFTASNQHGELQPVHQEFAPGFFLNSDPKLDVSGSYSSIPGRLLQLEVQPQARGDWLALHLVLPPLALQDLTYIGFAARLSAPTRLMLRACLRSGLPEGGFSDCFFDRHILPTAQPHSHLDMLYLDACSTVPLDAPWRELILFLPCQAFALNLMHLHPFAV